MLLLNAIMLVYEPDENKILFKYQMDISCQPDFSLLHIGS